MTNREIALINDKRIEELALYTITKGTTESMYPKAGIKSTMEEIQASMAEQMMKMQDKFAEFKRMIKSGEFTLRELEDKVYGDYGVLEKIQEDVKMPDMKALEKLIRGDDPGNIPLGKSRIKGFSQDL